MNVKCNKGMILCFNIENRYLNIFITLKMS